jgi:hypothetical protein
MDLLKSYNFSVPPALEVSSELIQAIQLAQRQREACAKLRALDTNLSYGKFSALEFDEAFKEASVLTEKNKLIDIPKFD